MDPCCFVTFLVLLCSQRCKKSELLAALNGADANGVVLSEVIWKRSACPRFQPKEMATLPQLFNGPKCCRALCNHVKQTVDHCCVKAGSLRSPVSPETTVPPLATRRRTERPAPATAEIVDATTGTTTARSTPAASTVTLTSLKTEASVQTVLHFIWSWLYHLLGLCAGGGICFSFAGYIFHIRKTRRGIRLAVQPTSRIQPTALHSVDTDDDDDEGEGEEMHSFGEKAAERRRGRTLAKQADRPTRSTPDHLTQSATDERTKAHKESSDSEVSDERSEEDNNTDFDAHLDERRRARDAVTHSDGQAVRPPHWQSLNNQELIALANQEGLRPGMAMHKNNSLKTRLVVQLFELGRVSC